MKYEYSMYLEQNCYEPLLYGITFFVFFIIIIVFEVIKSTEYSFWQKSLLAAITCMSIGYNIWKNAAPLARGGWYLLFEDECDKIQVVGTVEELIERVPWTAINYRNEKGHSIGFEEALVVNGKEYYMISYGNTKLGDHVCMVVLPKSHFVLELYIIDSDSLPCDN